MRSFSRLFLAGAVVLSGACGGGSNDDAADGTTTTSSTTSTSTTTTSTTPPTSAAGSGTFGTVATTTTLSAGESAVDERSVPETENLQLYFGPTRVNGVAYSKALVTTPSQYRSSRFEIDAGRAFKRFRGEMGIPDDQKSATAYKVDISLDNGAPVLSTEVRFGEVKTIDLDVTNVLRVKVAITSLGGEGKLAIGNARFGR